MRLGVPGVNKRGRSKDKKKKDVDGVVHQSLKS